jgi:hypothetical protein
MTKKEKYEYLIEKLNKPIVLIKDIDHQQWIPINDMKSVRSDAEVKCVVLEEEE